ncbi:MAG TPA: hypothetical protein VG099_27060 [Gemmataceae bacterium]|nr:hypothetical protein [Gemmataceae bacterium]
MHVRFRKSVGLLSLLAGLLWLSVSVRSQEPPPPPGPQASPAPPADMPPTPNGVEILSRGPVHEAFAGPATEPVPTTPVQKVPPRPIDEIPPADKPDGNAIWIPGYWAYDDERTDYLWVSGTWRTPPPGKHWMAGYWKEDAGQYRWVPGFWTTADVQADGNHQLTYMPVPPAPPNTAPPGEPPNGDSFYVPGQWAWHDAGYVVVNGAQVYREAGYSWTAGYWARVQPGYVWIAAHYRWTPSGYIYISGYWDLAVARRGFLYAPVYVNTVVVGPGFVYTPAYAVPPTVIVDAFWVRPAYCHYYFGDYYGQVYVGLGFESCAVYYRRHYEPIFAYTVYEHRAEPRWASVQVDICLGRAAGRYPCPPRTLVEQVRVGYRGPGLVASVRIGEVSGMRTVRLEQRERIEAVRHAEAIRHVAMERNLHEVHQAGGALRAPQTASYHAPVAPGHVAANAHPGGARPPTLANKGVIPTNRKVIEKKKPDPHEKK